MFSTLDSFEMDSYMDFYAQRRPHVLEVVIFFFGGGQTIRVLIINLSITVIYTVMLYN